MRKPFSTWTKTLQKLGFKARKSGCYEDRYRRRHVLETLERRELLATVNLTVNPTTLFEIPNSSGAVFTFTRDGSLSSSLTVTFTVTGTATNDVDYEVQSTSASVPTSITIPASQSSATITIVSIDDNLDDDNETVTLSLSSASGSSYTIGSSSSATVTIIDNEPTVTLAASPTSISEGSTSTPIVYTFTRTGPTTSSLSIPFSIAGTAANGEDYTLQSSSGSIPTTITIPSGQSSATLSIVSVNDTKDEPDEWLGLSISSSSSYTLGYPTAVLATIVDNDDPPTISINNVSSVTEGDTATFTVNLSAASGKTITVDYSTVNGTAIATEDYTAASGTLTFAPGQTSKSIQVSTLGNVYGDLARSFSVALSNPSNSTISDDTGIANIADDDTAPDASVTGPTVAVPGLPLAFTVAVLNMSPEDTAQTFTYNIDWEGDSIIDQYVTGLGTGATVNFSYVYQSLGTKNLTVTATLNSSTTEAGSVGVSLVRCAVIDGNMYFGGTALDDEIQVSKHSSGNSKINIRLNGTELGPYDWPIGGRLVVYALAGDDHFHSTRHVPLEVYGDAGNDYIAGAGVNDMLYGGEGNDVLLGAGGDDILDGGAGGDEISGGEGNDIIFGREGADELSGDEGNDRIEGGLGPDNIYGGPDNDLIWGQDGDDNLDGGQGSDALVGGAGNDDLHGRGHRDLVIGGIGADVIWGGCD